MKVQPSFHSLIRSSPLGRSAPRVGQCADVFNRAFSQVSLFHINRRLARSADARRASHRNDVARAQGHIVRCVAQHLEYVMRHPLCIGVLHDLAAQAEPNCELLRVLDEFLWYDKGTQWGEGVMGFAEQPVRAMPTVATTTAVGDVVLHVIAKNMFRRSFPPHPAGVTPE